MKIYGYEELCPGNCNIVCYEYDSSSIGIVDSKNGEVDCEFLNYGRWYTTFSAAKNGMMTELQDEIDERKKMLDEIKSFEEENIKKECRASSSVGRAHDF